MHLPDSRSGDMHVPDTTAGTCICLVVDPGDDVFAKGEIRALLQRRTGLTRLIDATTRSIEHQKQEIGTVNQRRQKGQEHKPRIDENNEKPCNDRLSETKFKGQRAAVTVRLYDYSWDETTRKRKGSRMKRGKGGRLAGLVTF